MVPAVMSNPNKVASFIFSNSFNRLNSTFAAHSLLSFRIPSSFFDLGTAICPPKTSLALFHSTSLNLQRLFNHPQSVFEKITKVEDAFKLFDEMTQRQPLPSVVKFNQLLQAVTKMKHYSCSIELFKQMLAIQVPIDVYTISIVIKCCCHMYGTSEGFAVLGYGLKRLVLPNLCTFNTLLNGLVVEDRVLKAERLFKKLIRKQLCEPDAIMYNTMIKGLCKFGNNGMAIALLRLMVEKHCKPDVITYSTIIDSLCKDKMLNDALILFKEMVFHKGILPDVVTYNSLIHGLCNLGRWNEVSKRLKEMENISIAPDVQTYNILVDAFCKEGKVEDAESVINLMVERGTRPDIVTYNSLIDGYCLRCEMSKAKEVFDLMGCRGLVSNVVTYNSFLNGYCKNLKIEEAIRLFHEMIKKGMKPNVITYNTIFQGLFRVRGCPPDGVTYNILLQGLLKNRQLDTVEILLHEMEGRSFTLDATALSMLLGKIATRSMDESLLKLIGKLVPKEGVDERCLLSFR